MRRCQFPLKLLYITCSTHFVRAVPIIRVECSKTIIVVFNEGRPKDDQLGRRRQHWWKRLENQVEFAES